MAMHRAGRVRARATFFKNAWFSRINSLIPFAEISPKLSALSSLTATCSPLPASGLRLHQATLFIEPRSIKAVVTTLQAAGAGGGGVPTPQTPPTPRYAVISNHLPTSGFSVTVCLVEGARASGGMAAG